MPPDDLEKLIAKMIEAHIPEWRREEARAWLAARISERKSLERLG